jgi:hypothetical protein
LQIRLLILLTGILILNSCSVFKLANSDKERVDKNGNLEIVKNSNMTANDFFISKIEIVVSGEQEREIYFGSIKYKSPDNYILSIRNAIGIEAVRIFLKNDSIFINDRINKKLYYGSDKDLEKKFRIKLIFIPVLLGDFISERFSEVATYDCDKGFIEYISYFNSHKIRYIIDCKKSKVIAAMYLNDRDEIEMSLEFSKFIKKSNIIYPGVIEIEDISKKIKVIMEFKKIEYPWKGHFEFIPGNKYEILPLL